MLMMCSRAFLPYELLITRFGAPRVLTLVTESALTWLAINSLQGWQSIPYKVLCALVFLENLKLKSDLQKISIQI